MTKICYSCKKPIRKNNQSEEHIFTNAIGGKLKSKQLLCRYCNSKFGSTLDARVAKDFKAFVNFLNIKRKRGNTQDLMLTSPSGKKFFRTPDGTIKLEKPKISIQKKNNKLYINIISRDENDLKKIVKNLKQKYPSKAHKFDEVLNKTIFSNRTFNESLKFSILTEGNDLFRTITKMAINYYLVKEGKIDDISHLLPYLKGEEKKEIVKPFEKEVFNYQPKKQIAHSIRVVGNAKESILYAVIDFFSSIQYVIYLNNKYEGSEFDSIYSYDLLKGKELNLKSKLSLNRNNIEHIFLRKKSGTSQFNLKRISNFFSIFWILNLTIENVVKNTADPIFKNYFNKYGNCIEPNSPIGRRLINELSAAFGASFLKQLKQQLKSIKKS